MVHCTEEEELVLVTSIVDAQRTLRRGQTAYWTRAFQDYQQHVENLRHNLNVGQHKWQELKPHMDRFKACFDRVSAGDLSHDDQVEIAKIEYRRWEPGILLGSPL
ncbi:hypothetical protein Hanom_Chr15g01360861 [Helianthus anomalus]